MMIDFTYNRFSAEVIPLWFSVTDYYVYMRVLFILSFDFFVTEILLRTSLLRYTLK